MPDYIVCTRARKGGSFSSEPGSTRYLRVPDKKNPDPTHEITRTSFITEVAGTPKAPKCQDLVVFVHGYNVTQTDLIKRHRGIRTSSPFNHCAGCPSGNNTSHLDSSRLILMSESPPTKPILFWQVNPA